MSYFGLFRGVFEKEEEDKKTLSEQVREFRESYNLVSEVKETENEREDEDQNPTENFRSNFGDISERLDGINESINELQGEDLKEKLDELQDKVKELDFDESDG